MFAVFMALFTFVLVCIPVGRPVTLGTPLYGYKLRL